MKPPGQPRRTTGLTTRKPLGSNGRKPLRSRSPRRDTAADQHEEIRLAVYARDGHCRLRDALAPWGPCMGDRTVHHLRKASQGGAYTMSNLIYLCAQHNDRIEELPRADTVACGLVIPRDCQDPGRAWALMQLAGIVAWWWDGTPWTRPRPDALHAVLGAQDPAMDGRLP